MEPVITESLSKISDVAFLWGRPWGWDPKVAVWFIAMFFNLSFINYVVAGLHSYAG